MDVHGLPRQTIVDHFALLEQLALPQILQLLGKRIMHLPPENAPNVVEQFVLVYGAKHFQGQLIDINDPYLLHAARDEFWMHLDEGLEVADTLGTHPIHETLDGGKILHPQGNRRMLEKVTRVALAALNSEGTLHLGGVVFQRHQHAAPGGFMPRNDARTDADIQTPSIQGVIHRLVGKPWRA